MCEWHPIQITRGNGERGFRLQASVGRQQIYFIDTEHFRKTQQNCIHHMRATKSLPQREIFFLANINSKRAHIPGTHDNVERRMTNELWAKVRMILKNNVRMAPHTNNAWPRGERIQIAGLSRKATDIFYRHGTLPKNTTKLYSSYPSDHIPPPASTFLFGEYK
jgi:hypothetical protein